MTRFWLSSVAMTVVVEVQYGRIVGGPPIVNRFIGQPLGNLREWMKRQGGFREHRYE